MIEVKELEKVPKSKAVNVTTELAAVITASVQEPPTGMEKLLVAFACNTGTRAPGAALWKTLPGSMTSRYACGFAAKAAESNAFGAINGDRRSGNFPVLEASAIEAALALASGRSDGGRDGMDEVEAAGADVAVAAEDAVVLVSAEEAAVTSADADFAFDCSGADTEDADAAADSGHRGTGEILETPPNPPRSQPLQLNPGEPII